MRSRHPPGPMQDGVRRVVKTRSGMRCEAEVFIRSRWRRCSKGATEVHHMLPRSRGGKNLDYVGETYHLIHLCSACHGRAHNGDGDLMIEGSAVWDTMLGRPVYTGPDEYLSTTYPSPSSSPTTEVSSSRPD